MRCKENEEERTRRVEGIAYIPRTLQRFSTFRTSVEYKNSLYPHESLLCCYLSKYNLLLSPLHSKYAKNQLGIVNISNNPKLRDQGIYYPLQILQLTIAHCGIVFFYISPLRILKDRSTDQSRSIRYRSTVIGSKGSRPKTSRQENLPPLTSISGFLFAFFSYPRRSTVKILCSPIIIN